VAPEDLALKPDIWTSQKLICKSCHMGFQHDANDITIKRNEMLCPDCDAKLRQRNAICREIRTGDLPPDVDRSTGGARRVSKQAVRPKMFGELTS